MPWIPSNCGKHRPSLEYMKTLPDHTIYYAQNLQRLIERIKVLSSASMFYRRLLKRATQKIADGIEDADTLLDAVPYTLKQDLKRGFPKAFLAVPWEQIIAYFESSGTTNGSLNSSRSMSLKTKRDLDQDSRRRLPEFLEVQPGQVAVVNLPYAVTSSAQGFHRAFQEAGAIVVSADQGQIRASPTRTGDLVSLLDARFLATSDPLLLRDIYLYDTGKDIFQLPKLEFILSVGVPVSRQRRLDVEERFGKKILSYYGLSEFGAVGVPLNPAEMVAHEDFYLEIRGPDGTPARAGEIIVWDLVSEGSPLLRYQTGDVGLVDYRTSPDGIVHCYFEVVGRLKEAILDGGKYLFPVDFQDLIVGIEGVSPVHRVTVEGDANQRIHLDVQVHDMRCAPEIRSVIKARGAQLTSLPLEVTVHAWGTLFAEVYGQEQFRTVQTAKTLAFHDKRKGEWLVTY